MNDDARNYAPAAARNREPILNVLQRFLPRHGLVLEIASGSGEHITHFAQACEPNLVFQPSDPDRAARLSIDAWTAVLGLPNIRPAVAIDASSTGWPIPCADVVLCINMIHITPWTTTIGLVRGAARVLPLDGMLFLYGPYRRNGEHTARSNQQFDDDLRRRNSAWGVRDVDEVAALTADNGFASPVVEEMPANNLCLIFRRRA